MAKQDNFHIPADSGEETPDIDPREDLYDDADEDEPELDDPIPSPKTESDRIANELQERRPSDAGWFEHHKLEVDPGQKPSRIDVFLSIMLRNQSRTKIKNSAHAGCIRVNGKEVKPSYKVRPGDKISFFLPHPPAPEARPEHIPLDIRYEDDHILMVNKPPGMVVHTGVGNWTGTMIHALLYHLNQDQLTADPKDLRKPLLVHRIDKDTSGLLVVAKTEFAHAALSAQFFRRTTQRIYYALVWGNMTEDHGRVEGHVARSRHDRKKFTVYPDGSEGKHAVTNYEVLERFGFATLVKCKLETGRTHQIRVHLKHLGHTLFSDTFYGGDDVLSRVQAPKFDKFIQNCLETLPRQALHAKTLGFRHPETELPAYFEVDLPDDFTEAIRKMRSYRDTYLQG